MKKYNLEKFTVEEPPLIPKILKVTKNVSLSALNFLNSAACKIYDGGKYLLTEAY